MSFGVTLGIPALLHEIFQVPEDVAYVIALLTAFSINFVACRKYIFDGANGNISSQLARFLGTTFAFRIIEFLMFLLLFHKFGIHYLLAIIAIQATSAIGKFFVFRLVFQNPASSPTH